MGIFMNIVIISFESPNLGDLIIKDTCKYLVKELSSDAKISVMDIFPPKDLTSNIGFLLSFYKTVIKIFPKNSNIYKILEFVSWFLLTKFNKDVKSYYKKNLKKADKVIFAGGGLIKFSTQYLWNPIFTITDYCSKRHIPVYFNAVGVEGYDEKDFNCRLLKYSLNREYITISTRDDLDSLRKYVSNGILTGDSALWTRECYIIPQNTTDVVGIGVIRADIFSLYGFNITAEQVINMYVGIVRELEKRGYKWKLFCNGGISDFKTLKQILVALNKENNKEFYDSRPKTAKGLIKRISSYRAIIAARLHSNIIAVAYKIPAVGLIWNEKLKYFGEILKCPNRFIPQDLLFDSTYIVDQMEEAMKNGYDWSLVENLKESNKVILKKFINKE